MTSKAKTYLKNIQEADTEKKLIGIEIAFKQDMTFSFSVSSLFRRLYRLSSAALQRHRDRLQAGHDPQLQRSRKPLQGGRRQAVQPAE